MTDTFRDFLVDVGVRLKEERAAAGWETLELTAGDREANVYPHLGGLFAVQKHVYLCVKRGMGPLTDPMIVTDVDIVNEKTEPLRPGYDIVQKTVTGANWAKLHPKLEFRLIVKKERREDAQQGLYDLKIINMKMKEAVPQGYRVLQHCSHDDLRVAVDLRGVAPIPRPAPVVPLRHPDAYRAINGAHSAAADGGDSNTLQRTHTLSGDPRNPHDRLLQGVQLKISERYTVSRVPLVPPRVAAQVPDVTEDELMGRFSYDFTVELRVIDNSRA